MKHMKMMWTAEIEIFKWRYDRRMYESRNRTQNIEPHVCDCLLLLPFSLRECSKFWVSSEAGRAEGNIGVISFLNPLTGDGISGENQPAVFVAISCRLRPAEENEFSHDYLFFFSPLMIGWEITAWILIQSQSIYLYLVWSAGKRMLPRLPFTFFHFWLVEKLGLEFWSNDKATSCCRLKARENACSRDYPFFYFQPWLVEKLEREFLTKHKATFWSRREARVNACSRDYPCFLHSWLVEKSEREF